MSFRSISLMVASVITLTTACGSENRKEGSTKLFDVSAEQATELGRSIYDHLDRHLQNITVVDDGGQLRVYADDVSLAFVESKLNLGADPNYAHEKAEDAESIPILIKAAGMTAEFDEIIEYLLNSGADPDAYHQFKSTKFHVVGRVTSMFFDNGGGDCSALRNDRLQMLYAYGADFNIKDVNGNTALDVLKSFGDRNPQLVRKLKLESTYELLEKYMAEEDETRLKRRLDRLQQDEKRRSHSEERKHHVRPAIKKVEEQLAKLSEPAKEE